MFKFTDAQTKQIAGLYNNEKFSDVRILLDDGEHIHAHSLLLYVSSEHFRAMLDAPMRESIEHVIDMKGYHPEHVRMCIKSLYDPKEANKEIRAIIDDSVENYGLLLNLITYTGLNRLQYLLESISENIFDDIWKDEYCMKNLVESIVRAPGEKKRGLATKIISKVYENIDRVSSNTDTDTAFLRNFMVIYNEDLLHISRLYDPKFTSNLESRRSLVLFLVWVTWYEENVKRDSGNAKKYKEMFDDSISQGAVNMVKLDISNNVVLDYTWKIKNTHTYGFLIMQYPVLKTKLYTRAKQIREAGETDSLDV
jgi:hypothetical protein